MSNPHGWFTEDYWATMSPEDRKTEVNNLIPVLDKGYVRLIDRMGNDLTVCNAARASYMKESTEFTEKDEKLVRFLGRMRHSEPFRHAFMTFEVKAPLFVCRQWWRYVVGSNHGEMSAAWSEASRRYVTLEPEFYIPRPEEWRSKPANSKQGSGEAFTDAELTRSMEEIVAKGMLCYEAALEKGVAPEQARGFLPAYFLYTVWRWSGSLQSVLFFLSQRLEDDAQSEIREYAQVIAPLVQKLFPVSYEAFLASN